MLGLRLEEGAVGNLKSEENEADATRVVTGEPNAPACDNIAEPRLFELSSLGCSGNAADFSDGDGA